MKNTNECSGVIELELIESLLDSKTKYRKIVQAAIAQWVKDYQSGKIQINTVNDLRTLVFLDSELHKGLLLSNKMKVNRSRKRGK
ncbi:hypothetical protein [Brevibacillus nitrificans]|uniref:hypothetical protein n=1 Tax=Brevibacillus nitrificans TaxID=651560 RepID=UPI002638BB1A|nr:hypothetical protein [Brevibacillus nitrificans]